MNTVITPKALKESKFKTCKLSELKEVDADELFLFVFPSNNPINRANGDGDLLEIHDFEGNCSAVYTSRGKHKATADTEIHYR